MKEKNRETKSRKNSRLTHRVALCQIFHLLTIIVFLGCDRISEYLSESPFDRLQISDAEAPPPETFDILCDASDGSTCTETTLHETLASVCRHSSARPGSRIRLWKLGTSLSQTTVVAEATSPAPPKKRKPKAEPSAWPEETTERFLNAIKAEWPIPSPKRTPLAESITKIGNADSFGFPRQIVVLTDAREYRLGNFECHPPNTERWRRLLKQHGALPPDSLHGVSVMFVNVSMPPVSGCALSLARENRIRELWETAMKDAGATFSITSGAVRLETLENTTATDIGRR